MKHRIIRAALGIAMAATSVGSWAMTYTWTGSAGANWATSSNWSPAGVPANGDSLVFPGGVATRATVNDLPSGTSFATIAINDGSYRLSGNAIGLTQALYFSYGDTEISLPIDLGANNVSIDQSIYTGSTLALSGALSGTGVVTLYSPLRVSGTHPFAGSFLVSCGTGCGNLISDGASLPAAAVQNNAYFTGSGTFSSVTSPSMATLDGTLQVTNASMGSTTFQVSSASSHGALKVSGSVSISGAFGVNALTGFMPVLGETLVLIDNTGPNPIQGTFYNAGEGSTITLNGGEYRVSYVGGTGNDLTLTATFVGKTWTGAVDDKWSTAGNWAGGVAPQAGDALVFPSGATRFQPVNDLPAGLQLKSISLQGNYSVSGNGITLTQSLNWENYSNVLALPIEVAAGGITVGTSSTSYIPELSFSGVLSGSGAISLIREIRVSGTHTYSGAITVSCPYYCGALYLDGATLPADVTANSTFVGSGTIGNLAANSYVSVNGALSVRNLSLPNYLAIDVNRTARIAASGTVALGGTLQLNVDGALVPSTGDVIVLVDNRGASPVSGSFYNAPEGSTVAVNGASYKISYVGGDGNDVVLTATFVPKQWTGAVDAKWSTPGNWSDGVAPVNGDGLAFPAGAANHELNNDIAGLSLRSLLLGGSYVLRGNGVAITEALSVAQYNEIHVPIDFGANAIAVASSSASGGALYVAGPISGSGTISLSTQLYLAGSHPFSGSITTACANGCGYISLEGNPTLAANIAPQYGFSGTGTMGDLSSSGYLSMSGILNTRNLSLSGPNYVYIGGAAPGTGYSQLNATGTVSLGGNLQVQMSNSLIPSLGQVFTLVQNDGTDAIGGAFNGFADGATVLINGYQFLVSYSGGTGNDFTLTSLNGKPASTTTIALDRATASPSEVVTITATVGGPSGAAADGQVTLFDGSNAFTSQAIANGTASVSTTFAPGAHVFRAEFPGNGVYGSSASGTVTLTVTGSQSISFGALTDRVIFDPAFDVSATGGASGNPVVFSTLTPDVCVAGNPNGVTISFLAPGTCTIAANQAAGNYYAAAPQVTQSFTVKKKAQPITFAGFANKTFGDAAFVASASGGGSGNPVVFASQSTSVCTTTGTNGTTITLTGAGTCSVKLSQAGTVYYEATETLQGFTVAKAAQSIAFGALSDRMLGTAPFAVSATGGASGNAVTFASSTTATCTVSATTVTLLSQGTCSIVASQGGNGNYAAAPDVTQSFTVSGVLVKAEMDYRSDFNGDGRQDIAWKHTDGSAASWLMNANTQIGGARWLTANSGWTLKLVGDLDGDGDADLIWQHTDGRVASWILQNNAQVGGALFLSAGNPWSPVFLGDFNGDGKQDIVYKHPDGRLALWLMNGATQVGGGVLSAGAGWTARFVADFNGDGRADILWEHDDGRAAIWLMNGTAQVGGGVILAANSGYKARLVGDFNGDGKADILWEHADGRSAMWLMDGVNQGGSALLLGANTGWRVTRVGDITGDGKADIVWQHVDGSVAVWVMNGPAQLYGLKLVGAGTGWTVKRVADFSGDNRGDVLMQNAAGEVRMWLIDGTAFSSAVVMPAGSGWVTAP